MKIETRPEKSEFDFASAVTQPFRSSDGRAFAFRLAGWMTAGLTLVYLITIPFILPYYGQFLEYNWLNMQATLNGGTPADPQVMMSLLAKSAPAYVFMMIGMWIVMVSGEAALHRKILLGEEAGRLPLRLGKQELRVFLAQLGVWGIWFVIYIGGLIIITFAAMGLSIVSPILGGIVAAVLGLGMLVLLCGLPGHLGPAAALSVANGKSHVLVARKVTKHRFWNVFLAYLVIGFLGYMGIYAVMGIVLAIVTGNPDFGMAMSGFGGENPIVAFEAAATRFKNPVYLLIGVAGMIVYAFITSIWLLCVSGVGTYVVSWWAGDDPSPNFD